MSPVKSTFGAASAFGWLPRKTANPSLTNVEYTLWGGGSTNGPGGIAVKDTGKTLSSASPYTVTVGAANSPSYLDGAVSAAAGSSGSISGNIVNGTTTQYSSNTSSVYVQGWDAGYNYYYYGHYAYGGGAGAAGNGQAALGIMSPTQGGAGGTHYTSVTSVGLAGFPSAGVGNGGGGGASQPYVWVYQGGNQYQAPFYTGSMSSSGANSGCGATYGYAASTVFASSGGFTMRYSNTQLPLSATTGDVVYLNSGGYHNYFWKSTGSFTI